MARSDLKRRVGAENGNASVSDGLVRRIRELRARDPRPTYKQLAAMTGCRSWRYVRAICLGWVRSDVGGPIEDQDDDGNELPAAPFDESKIIRCQRCNSRSHPSIDDPSICYGCLVSQISLPAAA